MMRRIKTGGKIADREKKRRMNSNQLRMQTAEDETKGQLKGIF
jgi:hypothetical protein